MNISKSLRRGKCLAALLIALLLTGEGWALADSLHYRGNENVGDVHPWYDETTNTWYMYYLQPGTFASQLLRSRDMITWTPAQILRPAGGLVNYDVLGVLKDQRYYSWFGYGSTMCASVSDDLLTWQSAGYQYTIGLDRVKYPFGGRDPYVFYDPDAGCYRAVCLAYKTNQLQGNGKGMRCMLASGATKSGALDDWGKIDTTLREFDGLGGDGEPECPQAMKIGNRWYLMASLARRHVNHVGRLSYYIGDPGAGFLEQDWSAKEEHVLTSDDLCAGQLAVCGQRVYLFGWIVEKWNGGTWGGHLSLPLEISQDENGVLYTALDKTVSAAVRGPLAAQGKEAVSGSFSRYDAEVALEIPAGGRAVINLGAADIVLDAATGSFAVMRTPEEAHSSYTLPKGALDGVHLIRVIGEEDILEVFLDDRWSLAIRLDRSVHCSAVRVEGAKSCEIVVYELAVPK